MEFTKGPWEVVELKSRIPRAWNESFLIGTTEEYGKQCTAVAVTVGGIGDTEKANSNLLAASPDLYEALKNICDSLLKDSRNMIRVDHDELLRLIAEARVSLGKAEGK